MGFSVSASTAVIVVGLFLAFGMFFPAMSNSVQLVHDAESDRADRVLGQQNTDIELAVATYNASGEETLLVNVTNTGSTAISVEAIDLLVDNELQELEGDDDIETTIDGDNETTVFSPGETLSINVSDLEGGELDEAERVLVAVDHGITVSGDVDDPAFFEVVDLHAPDEVEENETFDVRAEIENTGDLEATQEIELRVDDDLEDSQNVTLEGGELQTILFLGVTIDDAGTYDLEVRSDDDEDSQEIEVTNGGD